MNLGMTAVVLVTRGTMDTKIKEHMFHGARLGDLREVVLLAEKAMLAARGESGDKAKKLPLFGVGYSMGAIILANYCGTYGEDAKFRGAVHFSGMYDGVANMMCDYSEKTWQAYLCFGLKSSLLTGRLARVGTKRGVDIKKVMTREVSSVVDIDRTFVTPFNGYKVVEDYYKDMSVGWFDKWKKVKVPVLAIVARDDPITHCDSMHAQQFSKGNENMLFLVTDRGGHVGWPGGWKPWEKSFGFMNEAIVVFIETMLSLK